MQDPDYVLRHYFFGHPISSHSDSGACKRRFLGTKLHWLPAPSLPWLCHSCFGAPVYGRALFQMLFHVYLLVDMTDCSTRPTPNTKSLDFPIFLAFWMSLSGYLLYYVCYLPYGAYFVTSEASVFLASKFNHDLGQACNSVKGDKGGGGILHRLVHDCYGFSGGMSVYVKFSIQLARGS